MAETLEEPPTLLSTIGEEIIRIIAPVSACMLLVVLLVSILSSSSSDSPLPTIVFSDDSATTTSSLWDKLKDAILSSIAFVATVTVLTFLLVLLFYFRCTSFLKYYMAFSSFIVLAFLGGEVTLFLIGKFSIPIDSVTFFILLLNFSVVGVVAIFMSRMAIVITQSYLVFIGVLVAYWFTMLPEWTTWALLISMALYDLAAVLLPGGPLRLLVELAISRNEDIPALVYEARPVDHHIVSSRRLWRNSGLNSNGDSIRETLPETRVVVAEDHVDSSEVTAPLISSVTMEHRGEDNSMDGIGLGASGAIKLGLGDFIFYSVLVGRAALYDFMTAPVL
ncbi:Peptidase A22A presenilin protein [Dioscorea alata]|uniref:Peptidase A22A presenilin protein n=2 Tax=Dioscorea alata TaxID=55571 RepID=A0ACB7UJR6_DIOAL|nr:Peptidase A22A presenilin protein [Dioscorea alata]KAH7660670.1 Peptidase A22A presenilin protein [Dioscorea alata]